MLVVKTMIDAFVKIMDFLNPATILGEVTKGATDSIIDRTVNRKDHKDASAARTDTEYAKADKAELEADIAALKLAALEEELGVVQQEEAPQPV